jgi:hypothetical protein
MSFRKANSKFYLVAILILALGEAFVSKPSSAQEVDSFEVLNLNYSTPLESLVRFAKEMNNFEPEVKMLVPSRMVSAVQEPRGAESLDNLPMPTAKVSEGDFSRLALQNQKVGELGGSPYGATSGKATFGKTDADNSFQGVIKDRAPMPLEVAKQTGDALQLPEQPTPEQVTAAQERIANLKGEMEQLSFKMGPFSDGDYKAYEKTKELFQKNEKLISRLGEFDEGFVKNAKELYVNHSWRDMDKVGKRAYENFIEREETKTPFPYPKEQEPKPEKHREGISH